MSKTTLAILVLALPVVGLGSGCDDGDGAAPSPPESTAAGRLQPALPKLKQQPKRPGRPPAPAPNSRVAEGDPIAAVLAELDAFSRMEQLATLLPSLGPEALPSVRAHLSGLNDGTQEFGVAETSLLLDFWARQDAEEAARWALFSSPRAYRSGVIVLPVAAWAREDPPAAAAVVTEFIALPGLHTEMAYLALVWGWFDSGKPGLEEFIQGKGANYDQQRLIGLLAKRKVEREGVEATIRWAEGLPEGDQKYKLAVYRQTGKALARAEPAAAAAWCDEQCDGPFGDGLRSMIAQHMAWRDGPGAMEWASQAPAGKERDQAVKSAFRGWWPIDREGFMQWSAGLERDGIPEWFQPAIALYASGLARKESPEDGARWAMYVEDPENRRIALQNVGRVWRQRDVAAAEAWLETTPLTEEERESVRNPVPGRSFTPTAAPKEP